MMVILRVDKLTSDQNFRETVRKRAHVFPLRWQKVIDNYTSRLRNLYGI